MNLPGFYFDPKKNRYFKIESSKTAPTESAHSSDNVKKRKLEDAEAALQLSRMRLNKGRIKRAQVLSEPLMGGFWAREMGGFSPEDFAYSSRPYHSVVKTKETQMASFAKGLVEKGCLPFADARCGGASKAVKHMCITLEDAWTGLGVGFATVDGTSIDSTYIPRDGNGRIHRRLLADYPAAAPQVAPHPELVLSQISDMKYDNLGGYVLVTHREPSDEVSLWAFRPVDAEGYIAEGWPQWPLGEGADNPSQVINLRARGPARRSYGYDEGARLSNGDYQANVVALAPPGSQDQCAVGSNRGILQWNCRGDFDWLAPKGRFTDNDFMLRDIFDLDYQKGHSQIILAGGRGGHLFLGDTRMNHYQWRCIKHPSSITHLKSISQYHIFVSGLKDTMCIYDTRMVKKRAGNPLVSPHLLKQVDSVTPILTFPGYKNKAHIHIGLDVDTKIGMVAAAHDDGKIALYSINTGHRLSSPDTDQIQADLNRGPIQAVEFQKLPRDDDPTLFVGIDSHIQAFSFGVRDLNDEA
ncbi:hypothetical protein BJ170DRAFT_590277 [Xylariales sp. AK1849]|nr:hypothetical protein BJ170DRAFT_590277 [Xylariales sp. AK1849]